MVAALREFFRQLFARECEFCGFTTPDVKTRRRKCAYADDRSNWMVACDECAEADDAYWKDMWAEYRASQGWQ